MNDDRNIFERTSDTVEQSVNDWQDLIDLIASFDIIDYIDGVVGDLRYAPWRDAWNRNGITGVIGEGIASLLGWRSHRLAIQRHAGWSGVDVETILGKYHISLWGRGFTKDSLTFLVKERQARWAEYVLQSAGAPVVSKVIDPKNIQAFDKGLPRAWDERT